MPQEATIAVTDGEAVRRRRAASMMAQNVIGMCSTTSINAEAEQYVMAGLYTGFR